jgi:hypothetical protein
MSGIWSWTYFYNLHWNNYLYYKGLLYIWEWMIMMALLHMAGQKYMPPPRPYFKVNICPFPLPHFASIFFAYLWSFRWPNYIVTLPRYFSFRLPHLKIKNFKCAPQLEILDPPLQSVSHVSVKNRGECTS